MVPSPLAGTLSSLPAVFPVADPARAPSTHTLWHLGVCSVTGEDGKGPRWESPMNRLSQASISHPALCGA